MANPFNELRERLLRAGVAPRHVRRYLVELSEHLADLTAEEESGGRSRSDAQTAALLRLGGTDELARAMTGQRQFQSLCARAPWAAFGLGPLFLLGSAYLVACSILWSGWIIFLPEAPTPFVRLGGLPVLYFGVGRLIYFSAPVLVGWAVGIMAARQRIKAAWPAVGMALVSLAGAAAQVNASRPTGPGAPVHVSMSFALGSSIQGIFHGLLHALVILAAALLPWLVWRIKRTSPLRG